jgi:hypothetical protein
MSNKVNKTMTNDELLILYGLFKQVQIESQIGVVCSDCILRLQMFIQGFIKTQQI